MLVRIEFPEISLSFSEGLITFQNMRELQAVKIEVELEQVVIQDGHKTIQRSTIYDLQLPNNYGVRSICVGQVAVIIVRPADYDKVINVNGDYNPLSK